MTDAENRLHNYTQVNRLANAGFTAPMCWGGRAIPRNA